MQTFLPHPSFAESARCLDDRRLQNQVKECAQIFCSLRGGACVDVLGQWIPYSTGGYPEHPATLMWAGHQKSLCWYAITCIYEMRSRGQKGMKVYEQLFTRSMNILPDLGEPKWLGDERLHSSHRSQLLKKAPDWYGQFGWTEQPGAIPYWWPTEVKS